MKKLIAIFITLTVVALTMSSLSVMASARNWIISPIASTYTDKSTTKYTGVDHDNDNGNVTGHFTRPGGSTTSGGGTTGGNGGTTGHNGTTGSNGGTTGSNGGNNGNVIHVTGVSRPNVTVSRNSYNNNNGKDDPNSPNYTGKRVITSDKNLTSPDTNAQSNIAGIAALAVCSVIAVAAVTCMKKYKED